MENSFDPNFTGKTSPYLLRRCRSLQEAEADARHRCGDSKKDGASDHEHLDNGGASDPW